MICMFKAPEMCPIILGIVIILFSLQGIAFLSRIIVSGKIAEGKIIRYEPDGDGGSVPVIQFTSDDGRLIENKPTVGFSADPDNVFADDGDLGILVTVKYDPENQETFVLGYTSDGHQLGMFLLLFIGIALVIFGFLELFGFVNFL